MKVSIEAPWTEGHEEVSEGWIGFFKQAKKQLLHFQKMNDSQRLRDDITGYDEVINSNEENALAFMEFKDENRGKFSDNLKTIEAMKEKGLWK